jgi:hypothetical protein
MRRFYFGFISSRLTFLLMGILLFGGCSRDSGQEVILRYKDNVLTRAQVNSNIPPGVSGKDSARWAERYIENWKIEQVLAHFAKKNVPEWETKISERLEDYKRKLLVFELQSMYLAQNFDTVITQKDLEEYYKANVVHYASTTTLYRYAYIRATTPTVNALARNFPLRTAAEKKYVENWCKANADYFILDSGFQPQETFTKVAASAPFDIRNVQPGMPAKFWNSYENGVFFFNLYYLIDVVRPGWALPLELVKPRVKEAMLNKRKMEALKNLESQLLQEANANNDFQ